MRETKDERFEVGRASSLHARRRARQLLARFGAPSSTPDYSQSTEEPLRLTSQVGLSPPLD